MSKEMTFEEKQKALVENLIKHHKYEKATNVAVFDPSKIELPKGVTPESTELHVNWFNQLTGATEQATAEINRALFKENKENLNVDGTLAFNGIHFNTSHHLKQTVGEGEVFGSSTTILDFQFTQECSDWIGDMRANNETLASNLFSK